jgi:hypothetical protein
MVDLTAMRKGRLYPQYYDEGGADLFLNLLHCPFAFGAGKPHRER